jgi:thymidylate kinase
MFAVWAVAVALDKRHKLILAQRALRRGFVVVTDRYPQDEIASFNDGPLLPRLPRAPEWLRRFERDIYARVGKIPPDLVLKLHVGAETVARREPDMQPALIDERLAAVRRLRFQETKIVDVDARAPLDAVMRAVKSAVWNVL